MAAISASSASLAALSGRKRSLSEAAITSTESAGAAAKKQAKGNDLCCGPFVADCPCVPHRKEAVPSAAGPAPKEQASLSVEDLVHRISEELKSGPATDLTKREALLEILRSYNASGEDWKRYEFWDKYKYTRNLIATDNKTFTLMLLCWNKGHKSPIHDHPCDGCWMRCVKGGLKETQYKLDGESLTESKITEVKAGQTTFINDSVALHKIENPSQDEGAITIHLYSPPYKRCRVWRDEGRGDKAEHCVGTYYSIDGEKVVYE